MNIYGTGTTITGSTNNDGHYCSLDDIIKIFPHSMVINLSNDPDPDTGIVGTTVNTTNLDECIDQADREIDSYVVLGGYTVPFTTVPPLVANLSTKMTIWNLHLRKYFKSEIWEDTYKTCQDLLLKIAQRKLSLGQEEVGVTVSGTGSCAVSVNTQRFTSTLMGTF